ncbi:MAG: rRNA maturation RNase YbeY [Anaerolineales bacterium]
MSYHIEVSGLEGQSGLRSPLARAAQKSLSLSDRNTGGLSIKLTDDETMSEYHAQYLGEEKTTDVLSFPLGEIDPDTGMPYYGDILISLPQAQRQAEAAGHPLQAELTLLVVHGVLHLLGYDHADSETQAGMWQKQEEILSALGVEIEGPYQNGT